MTMTLMPPDNERWLHCIERVLAELKHPPAVRPARSEGKQAPAHVAGAEAREPDARVPR
jgi:hypothetical protein